MNTHGLVKNGSVGFRHFSEECERSIMEGFSSFEELVEKSKPMLRKIVATFPERHREDLIQEGILGLHNAYTTFDKDLGVPFSVYLRICVNNSILTAYKKLKKSDCSEEFDEEGFVPDGSMEEFVISKNDAEKFFEKLKAVLSPLEKEILAEYLKDKSYEEIADTLSLTVKTVDNALMRIKKKMRKLYL